MLRAWSSFRQSWCQYMNAHRTLKGTLSTLVWLPTGIVFVQYFYSVKAVRGRSMQPTLNPDYSAWRDIVLFDRYAIRVLRQYKRGDVVALLSPTSSQLVVKRVVALEGDVVKTLPPYPDAEVRVPPGHAWVEGDEPFHTEDSNTYGPVPLALIESKLSFVLWPPSRYGPLRKPSTPNPGAPRDFAWRLEKTALEREQWRSSRIEVRQPGGHVSNVGAS